MALKKEVDRSLEVELRSATLLDGVNVNVLKLDVRSRDKTLEERMERARRIARFVAERGALPAGHSRIVVDFPVSFQVGCMPVNLYERVQVETTGFAVVQALPAKRVLSYDQAIHGKVGQVLLDDAVWNIPFFVTVDRVELAREVMGVTAKPDELFLSVHALWTNIGLHTATMTDDPWRLVEGEGPRRGEVVALLDNGDTHLARNGGALKMPPVEPGHTQARWYVFRVPVDRLHGGPMALARQRYSKKEPTDQKWSKAGFDLWVPIKSGHPCDVQPQPGRCLAVTSDDWREAVPAQPLPALPRVNPPGVPAASALRPAPTPAAPPP
jgi:hypothetical protein